MTGLDVIKEYKKQTNVWLPMIDHINRIFPPRDEDFGDVNIGWNAGLLEANRPYFVECWATDGFTLVTIFVSTQGIEDIPVERLDTWFQEIGYYTHKDNDHDASVKKFVDDSGNEFFSINLLVGDEDGVYLDGAPIYSFQFLNDYNKPECSES